MINLSGVTRFEILEEIKNDKRYREFKVDYKNFKIDLEKSSEANITESLMEKTKIFFKRNGLLLNWREFDKLEKIQRIDTLSMISPITNEEKQKLLESVTFEEKTQTLENIISFYLHEINYNNRTVQ